MHKTLISIGLSIVALFAAGLVAAQPADYPNRNLRIVVPYAAGGIADLLGRLLAPKLSELYKQPVVVENRPGAAGHLGADVVAKGPADGYTLMVATIAHNGAFSMYKNLSYDPEKDLQPAVLIAESAGVLVVHPSVPANTVQEFLALAKSKPGQLNYGSAGNGSALHMAAELFKYMAGVDLVHIPYKGSNPAMADLVGSQIQLMFENIATAHPFIKTGKIRPLGVTGLARNPSLPDIPTIADSGVPGYAAVPWYTISVASGVSPEIVRKLAADLDRIIKSPDLASRWDALGLMPLGGTHEDAVKRNAIETERWGKVIRAANIQAN